MIKFEEWLVFKEFRSVVPKVQPATRAPADVRDFRKLYGPTGSFVDVTDVQDIKDVIASGLSGILTGIGRVYRKNLEKAGLVPSIPPTVIDFRGGIHQGNFVAWGDIKVPEGYDIDEMVDNMQRQIRTKFAKEFKDKNLDPNAKTEYYTYKNDNGEELLRVIMLFRKKNILRQHAPEQDWDDEEEGDHI